MGITIDKVSDGLPISVIVPLSKKRRDFFDNFVLPLIEANNPAEIIVNDNEGSAPKKRNDGFKKATQPFVMLLDDDKLIPANMLETMLGVLNNNLDKGYTYTGYHGIVLHPNSHPMKTNFVIPSRPFDVKALLQANYIDTTSLIRREVFPGFDETIKRLQDWDLYLTMLKNGVKGVFIPNIKFYSFYLDEGITSNTNNELDAITTIIKKHKIGIS